MNQTFFVNHLPIRVWLFFVVCRANKYEILLRARALCLQKFWTNSLESWNVMIIIIIIVFDQFFIISSRKAKVRLITSNVEMKIETLFIELHDLTDGHLWNRPTRGRNVNSIKEWEKRVGIKFAIWLKSQNTSWPFLSSFSIFQHFIWCVYLSTILSNMCLFLSLSQNGNVIRLKFVNLFNKLKTPRQRLEIWI